MSAPRRFPEPPRRPAWRQALRVRWPLAIIGLLLVLIGLWARDRVVAHDIAIGLGMLPGIAMVMIWMRGVIRYRVLLTSGVLTPCIVANGRRTFHDEAGREHEVRNRRFDGDPAAAAVVFDPHDPRVHRLVTPMDFVDEDAR